MYSVECRLRLQKQDAWCGFAAHLRVSGIAPTSKTVETQVSLFGSVFRLSGLVLKDMKGSALNLNSSIRQHLHLTIGYAGSCCRVARNGS